MSTPESSAPKQPSKTQISEPVSRKLPVVPGMLVPQEASVNQPATDNPTATMSASASTSALVSTLDSNAAKQLSKTQMSEPISTKLPISGMLVPEETPINQPITDNPTATMSASASASAPGIPQALPGIAELLASSGPPQPVQTQVSVALPLMSFETRYSIRYKVSKDKREVTVPAQYLNLLETENHLYRRHLEDFEIRGHRQVSDFPKYVQKMYDEGRASWERREAQGRAEQQREDEQMMRRRLALAGLGPRRGGVHPNPNPPHTGEGKAGASIPLKRKRGSEADSTALARVKTEIEPVMSTEAVPSDKNDAGTWIDVVLNP